MTHPFLFEFYNVYKTSLVYCLLYDQFKFGIIILNGENAPLSERHYDIRCRAKLGDNYHSGRYIVGYTVGNLVLPRRGDPTVYLTI